MGGFDPQNPPDPIAILGVTEGRRATDGLELFPCPSPDANGCYLNKFFLHGIRWCGPEAEACIAKLRPGESLTTAPEDENRSDPNAVAVSAGPDQVKIGYVPRYLAREVRALLEVCAFLEVTVERTNPSAPRQQRLLCRMNACWPEDFSPCEHEDFQPLPSQLPSLAT